MKKKKNDIYVVVDTPKKAKKLAKLLDMFGEGVYRSTKERLTNGIVSEDYPLVHLRHTANEWIGSIGNVNTKSQKTEVTIKELRNILAVEHLKEGDVVVCKEGDDIAIGVYKEHCDEFGFDLEPLLKYDGSLNKYGGCFDNFIRFATEEEKALLNTKPELEAGKWYIIDHDGYYSPTAVDAIVFNTGDHYGYGFSHEGCWTEKYVIGNYNIHKFIKREATPQEVEQALIKEAKKMGFGRGCIINAIGYGHEIEFKDMKKFEFKNNTLRLHCKHAVLKDNEGKYDYYNGHEPIFKDGKWAKVVKESPKFEVDIKIADGELKAQLERLDSSLNSLQSKIYYRIKPSGRLIFARSVVNLMRGLGGWKEYTGQNINELI